MYPKLGLLFFADRLPPLIGGMEIHAKYFMDYFSQHPRFPILSIITKNQQGQDCIITQKGYLPIELTSLTKRYNPAILFFNSGRWIEALEQLRSSFPKAKFIYRTGGNEILKAPLIIKKHLSHEMRCRYWVHCINHTIDILITNSYYTETRLHAIGITCPFRRFIGGVDISAFKLSKKEPSKTCTIFCAACFVSYKNHALMIDLIHTLLSKGYRFNVRLAGAGPLLGKIKKQVAAYKLSSVIKFIGILDSEKIATEMMHADIYMQLSSDTVTPVSGGTYTHSEGMGRAILEALTAGIFIIAGKSGALPEMVVPPYGILVNLDNFQQLLHQVEQALSMPLERRSLGDKFCWLKIFQGYEVLFE